MVGTGRKTKVEVSLRVNSTISCKKTDPEVRPGCQPDFTSSSGVTPGKLLDLSVSQASSP